MAEKTKRSQEFKLRLSPAEKALLTERANTAGLKVSEFVRRECGIGHFGRADLRRGLLAPPPPTTAETEHGPNFRQRVNKMALRMPRRTAERVVRDEEAREKAKAALG